MNSITSPGSTEVGPRGVSVTVRPLSGSKSELFRLSPPPVIKGRPSGSTPRSRRSLSSATVSPGSLLSSTAAAPATWGVAIDVPLKNPYPSSGRVLRIFTPGAASSTELTPKFEKKASRSSSSVAATATILSRLYEAG